MPRSSARATAAIFDLDRTLITKSSAGVFRSHLAEAGIGSSSLDDLPLADAFSRYYEQFGESWLMMQPARLASRIADGWDVDEVRGLMEDAAEDLADLVLPFAAREIEEHREAGRLLLLATTSPAAFVQPFADLLGFDGLVATEWERDGDTYTGRMDGGFIWGRAKAEAVIEWADEHDVDLEKSWAYSDSYFDSPAARQRRHGGRREPRPATSRHRRAPRLEGSPLRQGRRRVEGRRPRDPGLDEAAHASRIVGAERPTSSSKGLENIPSEGSAIVVFNHRSYYDASVIGLLISKAGRNIRGLGKKEVFDVPVIGRGAEGLRRDPGRPRDRDPTSRSRPRSRRCTAANC